MDISDFSLYWDTEMVGSEDGEQLVVSESDEEIRLINHVFITGDPQIKEGCYGNTAGPDVC